VNLQENLHGIGVEGIILEAIFKLLSFGITSEIRICNTFFRYDLRLEYDLEGSSNYIAWKDRMEVVLEDNGIKEFIDQYIRKPTTSNAQNLVEWKKCVAKARWIILEGVRDHILLSLHGKETLYAVWKALMDLF